MFHSYIWKQLEVRFQNILQQLANVLYLAVDCCSFNTMHKKKKKLLAAIVMLQNTGNIYQTFKRTVEDLDKQFILLYLAKRVQNVRPGFTKIPNKKKE